MAIIGTNHAGDGPCAVGQSLKGAWLTKTLVTVSIALICLAALAAPGAAMSAGFVVTDPGTLLLLGAALVSVGIWTRRLLIRRGERLSDGRQPK
jgi:hypothetical protein